MQKYEIGLIVKPNMDEAKQLEVKTEIISKITDLGARVVEETDLGIIRMAYEIEKFAQGRYFFVIVESNHELNNEFSRLANISEDIMRYIIVNIDEVSYSTLDVLKKQNLNAPRPAAAPKTYRAKKDVSVAPDVEVKTQTAEVSNDK